MISRFPRAPGLAVLLSALPVLAATDTWDGGGGNDLISLGDNWVDNTAPVSDIANTDLIFAGLTRLTPSLNASFNTRSITFNNTAGAFTVGGQTFIVGTGGIVNNDTQTMGFGNSVRFSSVANSTINASAGGLSFTGTVTLPTDTLAVTGGAPMSFTNFSGSSALNIKDAGSMTWTPSLATSCDVTVNNSTLTVGADGGADTFNSSASVAVNGTSTFNINEGLTLDGARLTRASGATVNIAPGKTLTVQNGGDAVITGGFTNNLASTIAVTGAGSTFSTTGALTVGGGSTLTLTADSDVTSGDVISIGTLGNGTVTVDGAGSTLEGAFLSLAANTHTGSIAFSNNSAGTFSSIFLGTSSTGGATGLLSIQSGADVTGTSLSLVAIAGPNTGTVTVTGTGSTLTIAGASNIGATSASSGTLNLSSGGTFNSGTGVTTVHPTGTLAIGSSGIFNGNGPLTVSGGQLTRASTGQLNLAPGTTFRVQNGGDAVFTLSYTLGNDVGVIVTGAGSTLSSTSTVNVNGGSTLMAESGGAVNASSVGIGTSGGNGTVIVDGAGSSLSLPGPGVNGIVGDGGFTGSLAFRNGGTGDFLFLLVARTSSAAATTGTLKIESGASVSSGILEVADFDGGGGNGTVTVTGIGSDLSVSGGTTAIGAASGGSGTLNIDGGGTFNSGTTGTVVKATGTVDITFFGTFNSQGNLTLNGGRLTRDSTGEFSLAAGKVFTVQAGGAALFTGGFSADQDTIVNVIGTGSTLSATSFLEFSRGSSVTASAGGSLSTAATAIGTFGNGSVTIDGAGSSLSTSQAAIGQGGFNGSLTFSNGSAGTFDTLKITEGIGTVGTVNIQSGASVLISGNLNVATDGGFFPSSGTLTVSGTNSVLRLNSNAIIGTSAGNNSTGTITVGSGGRLDDGSSVTLNALGTLNVNSGGTLTGRASFHGTGQVNIAGTFLPGTVSGPGQTASVSFAQNMTFHPTSTITMEIGGLAPGTQHDQIVFNGVGSTQVKWDGTLKLVLINGFAPQAGQTFNLFDFDAARDTGAFTTIDVVSNGLLPAGLALNFDELYTTGLIRVVSTGGITFAQWAATELGNAGAAPLGDHNGNGYTNLIEYALGLFPAVPATVQPNTALHVYPDGQRLRVLFTRPLDRTDITIRVQASADLTNWTDLAVSVNSAPFTGAGFVSESRAHPLAEPGLVEVRDILKISSAARRYLRFRVTLEP